MEEEEKDMCSVTGRIFARMHFFFHKHFYVNKVSLTSILHIMIPEPRYFRRCTNNRQDFRVLELELQVQSLDDKRHNIRIVLDDFGGWFTTAMTSFCIYSSK